MTLISRSLLLAGAVGALALSGAAHAADPGYTYVEAGYLSIGQDAPVDDVSGFALGGSIAVTDRVHVYASYFDGDADVDAFDASIDVKQWTVGAGLNIPVAAGTDFVGRLGYVKAEADAFGYSVDGDGYSLSAGLRAVRARWDLEGAVVYTDVEDEGDTTLDLSARYEFVDGLSFGPSVSLGNDSAFGVSLRYQFR
jgi:hypothetical protein